MSDFEVDDHEVLTRIINLVDFLRLGSASLEALMTHLLVDTFYGQAAFDHILNVVRPDGTVAMPAKSGFKSWPSEKFPERFITADTLLNRSLRTEQIVACGPFEDFPFAGTGFLDELFPNGFASSIAWPVPGLGSVLTLYSEVVDLNTQVSSWLGLVGRIISLRFRGESQSLAVNSEDVANRPHSKFALTSRQWNVLAGVRSGKTNPDIAQDLGYSESLVKQETMNIYKLLRVRGRKELLEIPDEDLPTFTM